MPVAYLKKDSLTPFDITLRQIENAEEYYSRKGKKLQRIARKDFEFPELAEKILFFRDFRNFEKFCEQIKIRTKSGHVIPFRLKRPQKVLWNEYVKPSLLSGEPVRVYILKARQIGFSTLIEAILYWKTSFFCNIYSHIVAHDKSKSAEIFNMTKLYYKTIEDTFRPLRKLSNRHELYFANPNESGKLGLESKILVDTADNENLGASSTIQCAHLSEFARYETVNSRAEDSIATFMQAVPKEAGSMIFIESTAYGEGIGKKFWYNEKNGFKKFFVSWVAEEQYTSKNMLKEDALQSEDEAEFGDEVKIRDLVLEQLRFWYPEQKEDWYQIESLKRLAWRREIIDEQCFGKKQTFQQDYPITPEEAFLSSGRTVFSSVKLKAYEAYSEKLHSEHIFHQYNYVPAIKFSKKDVGAFKREPNGKLIIYEYPQEGEHYFIGADIGYGVPNGDDSVLQVLNSSGDQVAVFDAVMPPDELGYVAFCLGMFYNKAYINPEANSIGLGFIAKLKELGYNNIYRRQSIDKVTDETTQQLGFFTSSKTKPAIITLLREGIQTGSILIRNAKTIKQLQNYQIDKEGRFNAAPGEKDDHVMSLALGIKILPKEGDEESLQPTKPVYGSLDFYTNLADKLRDKRSGVGSVVFGGLV